MSNNQESTLILNVSESNIKTSKGFFNQKLSKLKRKWANLQYYLGILKTPLSEIDSMSSHSYIEELIKTINQINLMIFSVHYKNK